MGKAKKASKGVLSPIQMRVTVTQFKKALNEHLDLLIMPVADHPKVSKCTRDCHVIERNHTVAALKHFIKNMAV